MALDPFTEPHNTGLHPPTIRAADDKTTLHRFYFTGTVYARTRAEAARKIDRDNLGMYVEAARLED